MRTLRHFNLVKYYGSATVEDEKWLVTELCDGSLQKYIEERDGFDDYEIAVVIRQIVEATVYMHQNSIVHRYYITVHNYYCYC